MSITFTGKPVSQKVFPADNEKIVEDLLSPIRKKKTGQVPEGWKMRTIVGVCQRSGGINISKWERVIR